MSKKERIEALEQKLSTLFDAYYRLSRQVDELEESKTAVEGLCRRAEEDRKSFQHQMSVINAVSPYEIALLHGAHMWGDERKNLRKRGFRLDSTSNGHGMEIWLKKKRSAD